MKRIVEREVDWCDQCQQKEAYSWDTCQRCQKIFCSQCGELHMRKFPHAVHFSGSDDGKYCVKCAGALIGAGDPLFEAYQAIGVLRAELKAWGSDFEARHKKAEATVKKLLAEATK